MESSLNNKSSSKSSSQKVKNILIRHSCSKEVRSDSSFQSPEKFHLLKYAPKYYHTLFLEVTNSTPLQSKIKRIKKLKNFRGYFKEVLPRKLWLNLLANTRKEIQEIPQTTIIQSERRPKRIFWARLTLLKVKFFPNIISLYLPRRDVDYDIQDYDDALLIKKSFMRYLRNMRKIKTLEIFLKHASNVREKWMLEKLSGMSQFLNRLEKLTMKATGKDMNFQELFKDKDLASHLTSLTFSVSMGRFDWSLVMVPQLCTNLRFLCIGFKCDVDKNPEFLKFLSSIQGLPHLHGLDFGLPRSLEYYWSYFKPPSSLRLLKLRLDSLDLVDADFKDSGVYKDLFLGHWDDIKELDELELYFPCSDLDAFPFLKLFITSVLKKVRKLKSFGCRVNSDSKSSDSSLTGEPFLVEEVPHLYGSLEKFNYTVHSSSFKRYFEFDMKKMRVFRNLREFTFGGNGLYSENIEEIVDLLQESEKKGDFPTLKLHLGSVSSADWLKNLFKKISQTKKPNSKLKIVIELKCLIDEKARDELGFLDELCNARKSVGFIKGLLVQVNFVALQDLVPISIEDLKGVIRKHEEVRNLMVEFYYGSASLLWRKVDGEKEQVFIDDLEEV